MMDHKKCGHMSFIAGLLLGGIVGATIGLLVAPETGEKTRAKVKKAGDKIFKGGLEAFDQFQEEQIEPLLDKVSDKADKLRESIGDKLGDTAGDIRAKIEDSLKQEPKPRSNKTNPDKQVAKEL